MREAEHVFCEQCGDCLRCYGEDACPFSVDGTHTPPKPEAGTEDAHDRQA